MKLNEFLDASDELIASAARKGHTFLDLFLSARRALLRSYNVAGDIGLRENQRVEFLDKLKREKQKIIDELEENNER